MDEALEQLGPQQITKVWQADDDLRPFDYPDLEQIASSWYQAYEETFCFIPWPKEKPRASLLRGLPAQRVCHLHPLSGSHREARRRLRLAVRERAGRLLRGAPGVVGFAAVPSFVSTPIPAIPSEGWS